MLFLLQFFAQVGFRCPRRRNPSDHFLRCINTDFDSVNESLKQSRRNVSEDSCATSDPLLNMETSIIKNMLIDRFQTSGYSETVRKQIAGISRFEGLSVVYGTGSEAGWWTQLNILIKRSSLNMSRDYGYYWLRIFVYIAVSLCVGTIFFSVGTTYNSILARAASGGFVTGFMTFMSIGGFPSFVEEMKVFQHERLNGYYGVGVYTISNFVSSSPFLLAITVSSGLITYFMVKLHPGISHLLYFLFNLHICMAIIESLMMIVTSMVPNFLMGMVTGAGVIVRDFNFYLYYFFFFFFSYSYVIYLSIDVHAGNHDDDGGFLPIVVGSSEAVLEIPCFLHKLRIVGAARAVQERLPGTGVRCGGERKAEAHWRLHYKEHLWC